MPRLSKFDTDALARTLDQQHAVIGRRQAIECGLTVKAVQHRIRAGGPWQVIVPGVYLAGRGAPTTKQRAMAAWEHAGHAIAITGWCAVLWHRLPGVSSEYVDVLVPPGCRRGSVGFVRLHRTSLQPHALYGDGKVKYVDPARAVADAVRAMPDLSDVRALVAAGVQRGKVELWQLSRELELGPVRGSALLRRALAEVADGARSTAEIDLLNLIRRARLPEPLYNPRLYVGPVFLASPDAWWPEFGVAVEVDSKAWHLSPADWARTLERHARMTAQGILVLHVPPGRLRSAQRDVIAEMKSAVARSAGPLPHIRTVPAARATSGAGGRSGQADRAG
jgi:hypothetical protein